MKKTFSIQNDKKILLSELLASPPPDDVLLKIFPCGRNRKPFITQSGLEIMKLRLDGMNAKEVGKALNLTLGQVNGRFQTVKSNLMKDILPDYIEVDVPGIRRLCNMAVPITSGYTKVSELLRDMPSDQELLKLSLMRGHIIGITIRRTLSRNDLALLRKKADGCRNADIARDMGVTPNTIRSRLVWIRCMLRRKLGIQIDVPELIPDEDEIE